MKNESFSFSYTRSAIKEARLGTIMTPHGLVPTPNFIFCATKASIKCVPSYQIEKIGADIILSNTYHLMVRPGANHIQAAGGLHNFMHWKKPLFTDSGGYQVFAMGHGSVSQEIKNAGRKLPKSLVRIEEEGVTFVSYLDGRRIFLNPENSIDIQCKLGADLIVQFDECTPFHVDKNYTAQAMRRSIRWGERSITRLENWNTMRIERTYGQQTLYPQEDALYREAQAMYGVIQGGIYDDLRQESTNRVEEQSFFATAIGGSLGSNRNQMHTIVAQTCEYLQKPERPIHLLGIGGIIDIFHGVSIGIDTFDCVHPTRIARHSCAIVPATLHPKGVLNLRARAFYAQEKPIDPRCTLPCCKRYSRAYLHYLCKANEFLAPYLLTIHNVGQMVRLMREIRDALAHKDAHAFYALKKFWTGTE